VLYKYPVCINPVWIIPVHTLIPSPQNHSIISMDIVKIPISVPHGFPTFGFQVFTKNIVTRDENLLWDSLVVKFSKSVKQILITIQIDNTHLQLKGRHF